VLTLLDIASVVLLGTLSGALLTEGTVLVPYWRGLHPAEFASLHHGFAPRLYRYFAPLTAVTVTASLATGIAHAATDDPRNLWPSLSVAVAAVSLLLFYGLYFKAVNARLPAIAAKDNQAELDAELRRWQRVHHFRTAICGAAFLLATVSIVN
jgi:Domain of unknown function (DUF1772)